MTLFRILLLLAGAGLVGWALYEMYRQKVMAATPTIGAGDVHTVLDGDREVRVEVHGATAVGPGGVLRSPLTGSPCVWYRVRITRKYTEWERDRDGNRKRVSKEESVYDTQTADPFLVTDVSGKVLLYPAKKRPDGATQALNQYEGARGPLGDLAESLGIRLRRDTPSTDGHRFHEWVLPEGSPLYALGSARTMNGQPAICEPSSPPYIISTSSEDQLVRRSRLTAVATSVGGVLLMVGTVAWWIMVPQA